jgi:hypothetical protein
MPSETELRLSDKTIELGYALFGPVAGVPSTLTEF